MWFGAAYFPCLSTSRLSARPAVHIESLPKLLKKTLDSFHGFQQALDQAHEKTVTTLHVRLSRLQSAK